jgi:hypothetical protein
MVAQPATSRRGLNGWHIVFVMASLCSLTACLKWPADNGSKQPDELLFERAMSAVADNRFDIAHITLQTLINTYPDSEHATKAAIVLEDPRIAECGESWSSPAECNKRFATTSLTD